MRRLLFAVLALAAGCDNHPCWPDGPPKTDYVNCPPDKPYINRWHPGVCYAEPQRESPPFDG